MSMRPLRDRSVARRGGYPRRMPHFDGHANPMRRHALLGWIQDRGDDADHRAIGGHQRPPELPGLAAASNWMRSSAAACLPETGTPAAGRTPRPPTPTANAEREADGDHLVARRKIRGGAQGGRDESSGTVAAWMTARSSSGCSPTTVASDSSPSANTTFTRLAPATTCRLVRMVPLSTMTTPAADTRFDVGVLLAAAMPQAAHAHHGGSHDLIRPRRSRRQRFRLERVQHGGIDVSLGDGAGRRPHRGLQRHEESTAKEARRAIIHSGRGRSA